jgi:EmrB/QacA subfamily drug resistance transporter
MSQPMSPSNMHARAPQWAVLAVACVAQFMVVLDVSIVNVALPSMQHSLKLSSTELQWVVNAYTLTFAGFLLFGGRAADLFGRKRIFLIGLTIFTFASLVGGFSTNGTMIVVARTIQGLGGAILAPSTLSLLVTTYTEQRARARALGIWSATAGSGGAFGALAGGVLTDEISWRWVLFVNVPIGVALFAAAFWALSESRGQVRSIRGLDIPGTVTVTAGLATLVYGIVSTDTHPWGSAQTIITLAIAVALLVTFVVIEARSAQPMVPLRIFRRRSLSAANGIALSVGACMFSLFFFLSLYMQEVLGYSALRAGVAFLPGALFLIAGATVASKLVSQLGPRRILIGGTLTTAAGSFWLATDPSTPHYLAQTLPPLILVCLGLGFSVVPMTVAATSGVDRAEAGLASGLINTSRQIGGAVGLAILATIAFDRRASVLGHLHSTATVAQVANAATSGYDRALFGAGVIAVIGSVLALTLPSRASHIADVEQSAREHESGGSGENRGATESTGSSDRTGGEQAIDQPVVVDS